MTTEPNDQHPAQKDELDKHLYTTGNVSGITMTRAWPVKDEHGNAVAWVEDLARAEFITAALNRQVKQYYRTSQAMREIIETKQPQSDEQHSFAARKLILIEQDDRSPGVENCVHIDIEGDDGGYRIAYVEKDMAAEVVRRWNQHERLKKALRATKEAIDILAARLIAADRDFRFTESGKPWSAMVEAHFLLERIDSE